ncbi:MAG TPA: hydratase [Rubrivivax sp.]|jgi:2-oxo-3-hexenedioate decarboxylase|nr:hydratase [Rubrivivax sp.]
MIDAATVGTIAEALLDARRRGVGLTPPSRQWPGFDLDGADRVAAETDRRRIAAGEQPRGWKIGFTNRTIWPRYGVHEPIWARVWDTTLTLLDGTEAEVSLAGLVQPRIEPEIVFGLAADPAGEMDDTALAGCIAWVAHGVEIVHTHLDGWRFDGAPDAVADFGLHGRLLVGPRVPVASWTTLAADLAALTMALEHDGREVDRGVGRNVLDGPLNALRLWRRAMAARMPGTPVRASELVTTGTITDAWPVAPGQAWRTRPGAARLAPLTLRFVG